MLEAKAKESEREREEEGRRELEELQGGVVRRCSGEVGGRLVVGVLAVNLVLGELDKSLVLLVELGVEDGVVLSAETILLLFEKTLADLLNL